jgi:hypothetical protein
LSEKTDIPHPCFSCGSMFIGEGLLCKTCRERKPERKHELWKRDNFGRRVVQFMSGNDLRNFLIGLGIIEFALFVLIGVTCL